VFPRVAHIVGVDEVRSHAEQDFIEPQFAVVDCPGHVVEYRNTCKWELSQPMAI
jgi:translation elongation factor EF-Tu-like GTPase